MQIKNNIHYISMNLNKRYCCLYLPNDSDNIYFELLVYNKDMNDIIHRINKELKIDFKIINSYLDDNLGLLLQDNIIDIENSNISIINGNLLFICHYANLEKYVKINSHLSNKSNEDKIFDLCKNFILFKVTK